MRRGFTFALALVAAAATGGTAAARRAYHHARWGSSLIRSKSTRR
jgi:hypothetical protein